MPWIEFTEPFATPPKQAKPKPWPQWNPPLDPDRGWGELTQASLLDVQLDLDDCDELHLTDCSCVATVFANAEGTALSVQRSVLDRADLSSLEIQTVRTSRLNGCKLFGTNLAGARIEDVVFDNCTLRHVNLRMATLNRVSFRDCNLDDVDLFETKLTNVDFAGSILADVNVDRLNATNVDLRDAEQLGFKGLSNLKGCLVAEEQLPSLMYETAFACGLGIEKSVHADSGETTHG